MTPNDPPLEIAPPRRAFLFIFLITGVVLLLNGLAVLFFSPLPRSPDAPPLPITMTPGLGGLMPLVAGILCLAGAFWMLDRHRKVARIAELVQGELPCDASELEGREHLLGALLRRAEDLKSALTPFPEALVTIDLRLNEHQIALDFGDSVTGRLSTTDAKVAKAIEKRWECIVLDDEVLIDLTSPEQIRTMVDTFTDEILNLPPDFELAGDIRISRRTAGNV